jgi:hypothetical protein
LFSLQAFSNGLPHSLTAHCIPSSRGLPYHYVGLCFELYRPVHLLAPFPVCVVIFQTRRFPPSALVFPQHIFFYVSWFASLFALNKCILEVITLLICTAYVGCYRRFGSTVRSHIQGSRSPRRMSGTGGSVVMIRGR